MTAAKRRSQESKILWLLTAAWPSWVPSPSLAAISLQYNARIFSLRRQRWQIQSRVRIVDGKRLGEFRLGSKSPGVDRPPRPVITPTAPIHADSSRDSLFGDLSPERWHRDDG